MLRIYCKPYASDRFVNHNTVSDDETFLSQWRAYRSGQSDRRIVELTQNCGATLYLDLAEVAAVLRADSTSLPA